MDDYFNKSIEYTMSQINPVLIRFSQDLRNIITLFFFSKKIMAYFELNMVTGLCSLNSCAMLMKSSYFVN